MADTAFDLVIFDNDGVLVDSEEVSARVDAQLLAECGLEVSPEDCARLFLGRSMSSVREYARAQGVDLPSGFEDEYHRRLFAEFDRGLEPVDGVVELIEAVGENGTAMCVASSGDHRRIETLQRQAGLRHFFEGLTFSAQDVGRGKPEPDLFLAAAEGMGFEPSRCVVIEDSSAGVEAALAAGMSVFAYGGLTPPELLTNADMGVFATMSELGRALLALLTPSTATAFSRGPRTSRTE